MPNIKLPLFVTRLFIFLFLLPWQIMRLTKPEVINNISSKYYKFSMPEIGSTISGVLMIVLLIAFVIGFKKKISYLLVLVLHALGTVMTIPYLIPGTENFNALFLAAVPVIGAMWLLWALRDHDTLLALK